MEKEDLKERLKKIRDELKEKLKYGSVKLGTAAVLLSAPASTQKPEKQDGDKTKFKTEILQSTQISVNVTQIRPEEVKIIPVMVNVTEKDAAKPSYVFHNKAVNPQGKEIKDFANATKYSIWDVTYMREVSDQENPVGVFKGFGGSMQYDFTNAASMMMYAMLTPKFENIGKKFFKQQPGFDIAFKNLENGYKEYGNFVFHAGNKSRQAMSKFLLGKENFKKAFEKEGLTIRPNFLELQRAFASDTYTSYDKNGLNKIMETLAKKDIKIEDVSWAIIGMWGAKHIASGGFSSIDRTLAGKSLEEINSEKYLNELANAFPSVFKTGSGKLAYNFAKEHFQEPRSITTMYELSLMTENPQIYENYLELLSSYQDKNLSFEQAAAITQNEEQALSIINENVLVYNGKCVSPQNQAKSPHLQQEDGFVEAMRKKYMQDSKLTR